MSGFLPDTKNIQRDKYIFRNALYGRGVPFETPGHGDTEATEENLIGKPKAEKKKTSATEFTEITEESLKGKS